MSPNDAHPPHSVQAGDAFLFAIWEAVSQSPDWEQTLLIITFDEHGGCYDHVLPPTNAATPDSASDPGVEGFRFDRFGVRVPTIVVSPYVAPGTVFRAGISDAVVPYDHTSILATLRDWLAIPPALMLTSQRIVAAPTLSPVLSLLTPRTVLPPIPQPTVDQALAASAIDLPLNDLQKSIITGSARRFGMDPRATLGMIRSRQDAVKFFSQRSSMAAS